MHKIIRVPEDVHRELKASAAREVKTLFVYADELLSMCSPPRWLRSEDFQ